MKHVTAILKPHRLWMVCKSLIDAQIEGKTILKAAEFAHEKGHSGIYCSVGNHVGFVSKVKTKIALDASRTASLVQLIKGAVETSCLIISFLFSFSVWRSGWPFNLCGTFGQVSKRKHLGLGHAEPGLETYPEFAAG